FCTVDSRCAMTSVVRSFIADSRAACTMRSLSASSALVASSSSSSGGFFSMALAARQAHPALAEKAAIALRQRQDELVREGGLRRRDHLVVARVGAAVAD